LQSAAYQFMKIMRLYPHPLPAYAHDHRFSNERKENQ